MTPREFTPIANAAAAWTATPSNFSEWYFPTRLGLDVAALAPGGRIAFVEFRLEDAKVPVIVDAGVGTASDVAVAFELGCHGVLLNTAIAHAKNPVLMASAMRLAALAGRQAFLAGRMGRTKYANASSPTAGLIE